MFFDPRSKPEGGLKAKVYEVIFEADTRLGSLFDAVLLLVILAAVLVTMLDTVPGLAKHHRVFETLEWIFTVFFTVEYGLRLWCVRHARAYAFSFLGVIDLLSILPTYLGLIIADTGGLRLLRALRLLRVFRVFQLGAFMREGNVMVRALRASWVRIAVFLVFMLITVVIEGGIIYYIEFDPNWDPALGRQPFDSIPRSVYWAIVTVTTVGYGDISPATTLGQAMAASLMLIGYGVIAVPTGIVSAEMARGGNNSHDDQFERPEPRECRECGYTETFAAPSFCCMCATPLPEVRFPVDDLAVNEGSEAPPSEAST